MDNVEQRYRVLGETQESIYRGLRPRQFWLLDLYEKKIVQLEVDTSQSVQAAIDRMQFVD